MDYSHFPKMHRKTDHTLINLLREPQNRRTHPWNCGVGARERQDYPFPIKCPFMSRHRSSSHGHLSPHYQCICVTHKKLSVRPFSPWFVAPNRRIHHLLLGLFFAAAAFGTLAPVKRGKRRKLWGKLPPKAPKSGCHF